MTGVDVVIGAWRYVVIDAAVAGLCGARVGSGGVGAGLSPAALCFAADAGSFSALRGEELRVVFVAVAPAQMGTDRSSQRGVIVVVAVVQHELA